MPIRDLFKVSRKTFFNPTGWMDIDFIKTSTMNTFETIKGLFVIEEPTKKESFAQAMTRLGLTDDLIQKTQQAYLLYATSFIILGIAIMALGIYLAFHHVAFHSLLISLSLTALCFAQAFRYHFWYFQIKHRKLGCTFAEWKSGKVSDEEKAP